MNLNSILSDVFARVIRSSPYGCFLFFAVTSVPLAEARERLEIRHPRAGAWLSDDSVWVEARLGKVGCEGTRTQPEFQVVLDGVRQSEKPQLFPQSSPRDSRLVYGVRLSVPKVNEPTEHWVHLTVTCAGAKRGYTDSVAFYTGAWVGLGGAWERGLALALDVLSNTSIEHTRWNAETGLLLDSFWEFGRELSRDQPRRGEVLQDAVKTYHTHWALKGEPEVDGSEAVAPAISAWKLEREGGIPWGRSAWAKALGYLKTAPRNGIGAISHRSGRFVDHFRSEKIWLDTLVQLNSFALLQTSDSASLEFALDQPLIYASRLQDAVSGLFAHSWRLQSGKPLPSGPAYWSRANGFALWSAVEAAEVAGAQGEGGSFEKLKAVASLQLQGLSRFQLENGLWDQVLNLPRSTFAETSGSLWIAAALYRGVRIGVFEGENRLLALQVANRVWMGAQEMFVPRLNPTDGQSVGPLLGSTVGGVYPVQLLGAVESAPPVASWKYAWLEEEVSHPLAVVGYLRTVIEWSKLVRMNATAAELN